MKKILTTAILCTSILSTSTVFSTTLVEAARPITVTVNGSKVVYDAQPVIQKGSTLVPLRQTVEALGVDVVWDNATQTITATSEDSTVVLTIGSNNAYKDGELVYLSTPSAMINGRTYVPLRFLAEGFGLTVDYDASTSTISVDSDTSTTADLDELNELLATLTPSYLDTPFEITETISMTPREMLTTMYTSPDDAYLYIDGAEVPYYAVLPALEYIDSNDNPYNNTELIELLETLEPSYLDTPYAITKTITMTPREMLTTMYTSPDDAYLYIDGAEVPYYAVLPALEYIDSYNPDESSLITTTDSKGNEITYYYVPDDYYTDNITDATLLDELYIVIHQYLYEAIEEQMSNGEWVMYPTEDFVFYRAKITEEAKATNKIKSGKVTLKNDAIPLAAKDYYGPEEDYIYLFDDFRVDRTYYFLTDLSDDFVEDMEYCYGTFNGIRILKTDEDSMYFNLEDLEALGLN